MNCTLKVQQETYEGAIHFDTVSYLSWYYDSITFFFRKVPCDGGCRCDAFLPPRFCCPHRVI